MTFTKMKKTLKAVRKHKRRAVKLCAMVDVDGQEFPCTAYDVSLGGVRLKVDAPFSKNENVSITFKDDLTHNAKVIWISEGYVGLDFNERPQNLKGHLSSLATNLN